MFIPAAAMPGAFRDFAIHLISRATSIQPITKITTNFDLRSRRNSATISHSALHSISLYNLLLIGLHRLLDWHSCREPSPNARFLNSILAACLSTYIVRLKSSVHTCKFYGRGNAFLRAHGLDFPASRLFPRPSG